MEFFKRHPLLKALLIIFIGAAVGSLIGGGYGFYETRQIADAVRAQDPRDPLDGLPFIAFAYLLVGLLAGIITGFITAIIAYFVNRRRS
jgi:ABC-type dipeptide/oligopeptide/nickel transport system permease subunit